MPGKVEGHALDILDPNSISRIKPAIQHELGRLDVLINNAADIARYGETAEATDLDSAWAVMDVTVFGSWTLLEAIPH